MAAWRSSLVFFLVGAAALVSASSCAQIIGLEPFGAGGAGGSGAGGQSTASASTGGGSSSVSSTSTSGSGGGTPCAGTCETSIGGWNDPVLVERGKTCSTGVAAGTLWLQLQDTSCTDCVCVSNACTIDVTTYPGSDAMCLTANGTSSKKPACQPAPLGVGANVKVTVESVGITDCAAVGSCTPPTPDAVTLCAPEKCASGGVCFEPGDTVCIYADGSMPCPNGYTQYENEAAFASYNVSDCTCGEVMGPVDCGAQSVDFHTGVNCGGSLQSVTMDECTTLSIAPQTVKYHPTAPGVCAAPTAIVATGQPVTVCCKDTPL